MAVKDYIREKFFPHIWCPGCGHGIVLNGLVRAIENMGLKKNDIVMVSGIGCSSRIAGYLDFHTLHTIHGRALAFAIGVKMSRPELTLLVPMGDGDALSIGGNHFIHACRRNIDMTAIVMNNRVYGMTGGQYSPLSGYGTMATTAPYSNIDQEFDVVSMATAAGATFVARTTAYHVQQMADILEEAIRHKGFSVVEVMTPCPTYFGRKNKEGSAVDMMEKLKTMTTPVGSKAKQENPDADRAGGFREEGDAGVLYRVSEDHRAGNEGELTMERCRMVFSGSGGQGVITAAIILAEAAVLHENLIAVQSQSYGPEARGGATRSDVIIAESPIHFPKVIQPNVLVCLTQQAYTNYYSILRPGGLFITDSHFVKLGKKVDARQVELPMYETVMEKIGRPIVFNICMLGAVIGLTKLVRPESIMKVLETQIPHSFLEMNRQALDLGLKLGEGID